MTRHSNAYPQHIKDRVIKAYLMGDVTFRILAKRFGISADTIGIWVREYLKKK